MNEANPGCKRRAIASGTDCIKSLIQGACLRKAPAVEPKKEASRYEGSKSGASVRRATTLSACFPREMGISIVAEFT
jgi:hypothetical protein